jgi:hypothetical protein
LSAAFGEDVDFFFPSYATVCGGEFPQRLKPAMRLVFIARLKPWPDEMPWCRTGSQW